MLGRSCKFHLEKGESSLEIVNREIEKAQNALPYYMWLKIDSTF